MHLLHVTHRAGETYLVQALMQAGHVVDTADDLTEALLTALGGDYDGLVVEVAQLSETAVRRLAKAADGAVLVMIADHAEAVERTAALRAGADACFLRPVHFMELEARLTALLRLTPGGAVAGPFAMDPTARTASLDDRSLVLPAREFRLLDYMARHAGEVISPNQILEQVWGEHGDPKPELVRTAVARLRARLVGAFGQPFLVTLRGHGYRLDDNMTGFSSG